MLLVLVTRQVRRVLGLSRERCALGDTVAPGSIVCDVIEHPGVRVLATEVAGSRRSDSVAEYRMAAGCVVVLRQWEFTLFDGPDTATTSTTGTRKSALRRIGPTVFLACGLIPLASITSKTQGQQAPTSDRSLPHHRGTRDSRSTPVAPPKDLNLLWREPIGTPAYPRQSRLVSTPASSGTVVTCGGTCTRHAQSLRSNHCRVEPSRPYPHRSRRHDRPRFGPERKQSACPRVACRVEFAACCNVTCESSSASKHRG